MIFSRRKHQQGKPALDLLEEAVALLRNLPAETHFWYYLGSMPFALALVFFWADMSRSGMAAAHLAEGSFGLTLLWLWMKCCQTVFAERTRSRVMQVPAARVSLPRLLRCALTQAAVSPWSLVVLPVALIITIPFGWCLTFFQNCVVLDRGDGASAGELMRGAWQQARLWPRQNHCLISVLACFSLVVFLNLFVTAMLLPGLLKTLFGIESIFGMGNLYLANSTLWVVVTVLTYLCVDPVYKVVCVLRCYHGEALYTGSDLLTELRLSTAVKSALLVPLLLSGLLLAWSWPTAGFAQEPQQLSTAQLDQAIDEELTGIEYSWRMPRDEIVEEEAESGFLKVVAETLRYWGEMFGDAMRSFFQWLGELFGRLFPPPQIDNPAPGEGMDLRFVTLYIILGLALCLAALMAWRYLQRRKRKPAGPLASLKGAELDLEDEQVTAADLPTERWLELARELLQKGERRLAVRAFYLAALARLAGDELLTIARAKSDREYQQELVRHGRADEELVAAFAANIGIFQQAWYGMRTLHDELLEQFMSNQQRIMTHVEPS